MSWDIFFTGVDAMEIMRAEGMFRQYQTPASKNFDKQYHHMFYSPNYRSSIIGFVYNTRYVKPADAPKSYWEYAVHKWDGKPPCPIQTRTRRWLNGSLACTSC